MRPHLLKRGLGPLFGLVLVQASAGCRCGRSPAGDPATDPACSAACAAVLTAGCARIAEDATTQRRCVEACRAGSRRARPAGCDSVRRRYLGCAATARIDCDTVSADVSTAVEAHVGIDGCDSEYTAWRMCADRCEAGTTITARIDSSAEVLAMAAGCGPECTRLQRGGGPGAPCQTPSVCDAHCCRCPTGQRFAVQVCAEGRCATSTAACQAVTSGRSSPPVCTQ